MREAAGSLETLTVSLEANTVKENEDAAVPIDQYRIAEVAQIKRFRLEGFPTTKEIGSAMEGVDTFLHKIFESTTAVEDFSVSGYIPKELQHRVQKIVEQTQIPNFYYTGKYMFTVGYVRELKKFEHELPEDETNMSPESIEGLMHFLDKNASVELVRLHQRDARVLANIMNAVALATGDFHLEVKGSDGFVPQLRCKVQRGEDLPEQRRLAARLETYEDVNNMVYIADKDLVELSIMVVHQLILSRHLNQFIGDHVNIEILRFHVDAKHYDYEPFHMIVNLTYELGHLKRLHEVTLPTDIIPDYQGSVKLIDGILVMRTNVRSVVTVRIIFLKQDEAKDRNAEQICHPDGKTNIDDLLIHCHFVPVDLEPHKFATELDADPQRDDGKDDGNDDGNDDGQFFKDTVSDVDTPPAVPQTLTA